ncbi:Rho GDP-dissociation inhibitor 1, partial [Ananas comosus]
SLNPDVHILDLTIVTPDRPNLILPIPFVPDAKGYAFALKDGSRYRLKFSFVVSSNIVSGLRYTNTVWKTGVRVETTKVMLGTFSLKRNLTHMNWKKKPPHQFVDDDGKCYLDMSYYFEIRKDWPSPS